MNASEFGTKLGELVEQAMRDGVTKGKISLEEITGVLELQKLELARHFQDMARLRAAQTQQPRILRSRGIHLEPPPGT